MEHTLEVFAKLLHLMHVDLVLRRMYVVVVLVRFELIKVRVVRARCLSDPSETFRVAD